MFDREEVRHKLQVFIPLSEKQYYVIKHLFLNVNKKEQNMSSIDACYSSMFFIFKNQVPTVICSRYNRNELFKSLICS